MTTIGSLCSGYGGLCELAVAPLLGGTVAWHAETDPSAAKILAHHWPGVPKRDAEGCYINDQYALHLGGWSTRTVIDPPPDYDSVEEW